MNTKLLEIIKIQAFYVDHFSIWESLSKQYSPNLETHINYMKQYVRITDFQLHLPNTLSNAKMVCILNVDIDEWNNIGIHDFFQMRPSRVPTTSALLWILSKFKIECFKLGRWPIWWLQMKLFFKYKAVRDHEDLHLIHCPFFHLDKF